jgi:hypothetical protein
LRGDSRLVWFAVATPIAEDEKIQPAARRIGGEQFVREKRADRSRLRGDKQRADKLATCLFHKPTIKLSCRLSIQNKKIVTSRLR